MSNGTSPQPAPAATLREVADPIILPDAGTCTVHSPYGKSLREFFVANGCDCEERSKPPIAGYDFITFPNATDYKRAKALLTRWSKKCSQ